MLPQFHFGKRTGKKHASWHLHSNKTYQFMFSIKTWQLLKVNGMKLQNVVNPIWTKPDKVYRRCLQDHEIEITSLMFANRPRKKKTMRNIKMNRIILNDSTHKHKKLDKQWEEEDEQAYNHSQIRWTKLSRFHLLNKDILHQLLQWSWCRYSRRIWTYSTLIHKNIIQ